MLSYVIVYAMNFLFLFLHYINGGKNELSRIESLGTRRMSDFYSRGVTSNSKAPSFLTYLNDRRKEKILGLIRVTSQDLCFHFSF